MPNSIDESEFEILREEMRNDETIDYSFTIDSADAKIDMKNIVEECFRLDENEMPKKLYFKII